MSKYKCNCSMPQNRHADDCVRTIKTKEVRNLIKLLKEFFKGE